MISRKGWLVAALGIATVSCAGASSTGNGPRPSETRSAETSNGRRTSDGGTSAAGLNNCIGSTGHNGLDPAIYHKNQSQLDKLMGSPLLVAGSPTSELDSIISVAGELLISDMIGCALPVGQTVSKSMSYDFKGQGLLKGTEIWPGSALSFPIRDDLHACIATLLNPYYIVPIWLGGVAVNANGSKASDFPYSEATWLFHRQGSSEWVIHVWPSDAVTAACHDGHADVISKRFCGTLTLGVDCHVKIRDDYNIACSGSTECEAECDPTFPAPSKPNPAARIRAIRTRLDDKAFKALYPGCTLKP